MSEKIAQSSAEGIQKSELVKEAIHKIHTGENRETVLMGMPEELKKQIEEELDREKTFKRDEEPSSELIPTQFKGMTSWMLDSVWSIEAGTVEGELEKNKKILALERLRQEEVLFIQAQLKEIESAGRKQHEAMRMGELRTELKEGVPGPAYTPVHFSEAELTSILNESSDRDSFRTRLKHRYAERLEKSDLDVPVMFRHDPKSVPEFLYETIREKYGAGE